MEKPPNLFFFVQQMIISAETKPNVLSSIFPSQVSLFGNFQQFLGMHMQQSKSKSKLGWEIEEERLIEQLFNLEKKKNWKEISKIVNQKFPQRKRNAKQCRERYTNFIKFDKDTHKVEGWKPEEERQLLDLYMTLGSKWTQISEKIQGKSPNELKNKFYGSIRRLIRKLNDALRKSQLKTYRKQISYQSIFRLLSINTSHQLEIQNQDMESSEKDEFIWNLKFRVLKLAAQHDKNVKLEQALEFCEKICKFNIVTRAERLKQLKNLKNPNKNHRKFLPPLYSKNEACEQNLSELKPLQQSIEGGSSQEMKEFSIDQLEDYQEYDENNKQQQLEAGISQMLNLMDVEPKAKFFNFYD